MSQDPKFTSFTALTEKKSNGIQKWTNQNASVAEYASPPAEEACINLIMKTRKPK